MCCQHLVHLADKGADAGGMDVSALHVHTVMYILHPVHQNDYVSVPVTVLQLHPRCFVYDLLTAAACV